MRSSPRLLLLPLLLAGCSASETSTSGGFDGRGIPANGANVVAPGKGPTTPGDTPGAIENDWVDTSKEATSTFGIDVDTGSYTIMRRQIAGGAVPDQATVRPEEYVNYFQYDYAPPTDGKPFSVQIDGAPSAFGEGLHLVRVALQGVPIDESERKHANLVFLVDVSGSMGAADKLPLVKETLRKLTQRLRPTDTLGIVTYAGYESVLLAPTPVVDKQKIIAAIEGLSSNGSTNGEGGIKKAYELAEAARGDGVNRVVLCTDGDFNVGVTGQALVDLVEKKRDGGVTLTTLGYGTGNYNDRDMEALADHGNGNYAYIDASEEIDRVVGKKFVSTLQVIAKDAKIQIDFRPEAVSKYRLVGYENRILAKDDFANDKKDSGDLGAGHNVTAFYEVALTDAAKEGTIDLAAVKLRYKQPNASESELLEHTLSSRTLATTFEGAPASFRFAAATAEYAEILRRSKHSTGARFDDVIGILRGASGTDPDKLQLIDLASSAKSMWR